MASGVRARRWDAGTVRVSARDLTALRVIGDHLAVRQTDLQRVLITDERAVRAWLGRMTRAGFVSRQRVVGVTWALLTAAGNHAAATADDPLPYSPRPLSTWVADHATTTLRLRLRLAAEHPGAAWRSERWWRRRQALLGKGGHLRVPDGSLLFPDGTHVAVEVEITRRRPDRYIRIAREYATDVDQAWWYTTGELAGWLRRTWEQTPKPSRPQVEVRELPAGVRP
ncbi:MAG TPA: hypothetical protein VGJ54_04600 [Streptosporangiaceae bacterium]